MNVKVDLSEFISNRRKLAIVYINPNSLKTVSDVIIHICKIFEIQNPLQKTNDYRSYSLHEGPWFIHPQQSSNVFEGCAGVLRLSYNENENEEIESISPVVPHEAETELSALPGKSKKKKKKFRDTPEVSEFLGDTSKKKKKENCEGIAESSELLDTFCQKKRSNEDVPAESSVHGRKEKKRKKNNGIIEEISEVTEESHTIYKDNTENVACPIDPDGANVKERVNNKCVQSESTKKPPHDQSNAGNLAYEMPLWNINLKEQRLVVDASCASTNSKRTRKLSEELESVGSTDLSVEGLTSAVKPGEKRYRKRKHNKKQKRNLEMSQEFKVPSDFPPPSGRGNTSSFTAEAVRRSHTVFSDEDEETEANFGKLVSSNMSSEMDSLSKADIPIPDSGVYISHSTPITPTSNKEHSFVEPNPKFNGFDSPQSTNGSRSERNKTNSRFSKSDKLDPPACSNARTPSEATLLKFKNILALEKRNKTQPKIFHRNEKYSEPSEDAWGSLPLAFGSRKSRTSYSRNEINNTSIASVETVPFFPNDISNVSVLSNQNSPTCLDSESLNEDKGQDECFVGLRAPKRNKRYFQSIGNVLSSLKKTNANTDPEIGKQRSQTNSPRSKSPTGTCLLIADDVPKAPNSCDEKEDSGVDNNTTVVFTQTQTSDIGSCKVDQEDEESGKKEKENVCIKSQEIVQKSESDAEVKNREITEISIVFSDHLPVEPRPPPKREGEPINFESYPVLPTLPKLEDIIAAKLMTLDATMCPTYSDYRPAKVISLDGLKLGLQFLEERRLTEAKIQNYTLLRGAKDFHCADWLKQESPSTSGKDSVAAGPFKAFGMSETYTTLDWRDLVSPRLLFP